MKTRTKILIHRYNDVRDILSAKLLNKFSDSVQRAKEGFTHIAIVPTLKAKDNLAVWATAASEQYPLPNGIPFQGDHTPGHHCIVRVDMVEAQYTTLEKVKAAIDPCDLKWSGPWSARVVDGDISKL